ncbi:MAG: bifunctional phosphoribosyl-AMP cyclohydrolase/phosphoribosyl-ATP diphosphatase HisIE [Lachnospiraceae bacterium]|nr:bifunctional phosphoribosyl-AMP cyclohydrolase/phosphoribosyl-ATP diphosphatase HisIE [Lachnospiraceae bacterium]
MDNTEVKTTDNKLLIAYINTENELFESVIKTIEHYNINGADEVYLYNYSKDAKSKEEFFSQIRKASKLLDIPFSIGVYATTFEDIKKAVYTGAKKVVLKKEFFPDKEVFIEGVNRFGKDKFWLEVDSEGTFHNVDEINVYKELGVEGVLLKHVDISPKLTANLEKSPLPIILRDSLERHSLDELLELTTPIGVVTNYFETKSILKTKISLKKDGFCLNTYDSTMAFDEFKLNNDGLIPVVTQDYKTLEVLMVAYMNLEAFNKTVETGRMTYWSRSRNELWCKGDTSGHVQYVKDLMIDCDNDTILARVKQVGAACHTGNRSCFYRKIVERSSANAVSANVLEDVYNTIIDRKENSKEGSYTNYLFDKGIDKILKKCGEEAAEIIIAAKNPDIEELRYEISDYLYHLMVLMAERGLDWEDIFKELANRH